MNLLTIISTHFNFEKYLHTNKHFLSFQFKICSQTNMFYNFNLKFAQKANEEI